MRLFLILLLSFTFCVRRAAADPNASSRGMAEVNGLAISVTDVDQEVFRHFKVQANKLPEKERREIRQSILQRLIERQLLLQDSKKRGLYPSEEESREVMAQTKSGFESKGAFVHELQEVGLDEKSLAAGLRDDLAIQRLLEKVVFAAVDIPPEKVKLTFEQDPSRFSLPEEIRARHIFFRLPANALPETREKVLLRAREVREEASRAPSDFPQLARKVSDGPNRASGGDLGYFSRNQMPKVFSDAVFALRVGEISEVIETDKGVHIVLVEDRRGGTNPSFEAVRDKIHAQLLQEEKGKAYSSYVEQLRKQGKVVLYVH